MTTTNAQNQLINFAIDEMKKMLADAVKTGKQPKMSPKLEKLASEIQSAQSKKMTDQEAKEWAKTLTKEVLKIDEEK